MVEVNTAIPIRPSLDGRHFDIVVIGGGINGVAIARECARAGRSTLLVERHDFAAGTTSRSTRIIHGGLRYLEHGEIGLVRESLRERQQLLRERPYLVRPIEFLLALGPDARRSALEIRFGLWLYKRFAGRTGLYRNGNSAAELERVLDRGSRWSVFSYEDAQCEFPERLVAEWLFDATEAGAAVRNHTEVLELEVRDGCVRSVLLKDTPSGTEFRVIVDWVINATGPWADRFCEMAGVRAPRMIGGVRGSHIVLPKPAEIPEAAVYTEAVDGRPIFLVPWNGQLLVGTTEVAQSEDPGIAQPTADEIAYLLDSVRIKFPNADFRFDQIRYSYAGVRPLPYAPAESPSAVTRRHLLHDHLEDGAARLISVIGGKLTTAASLARQCARKVGISAAEPRGVSVRSAAVDLETLLGNWAAQVAAEYGIPANTARAMAGWYGPRAESVARIAKADEALRKPLCPHTEHIAAEGVSAFQNEYAVTLADVLLRRVPVGLGGCWSEDCSTAAALAIGKAMGWAEAQIASQLENAIAEREAFLRKPEKSGMPAELNLQSK